MGNVFAKAFGKFFSGKDVRILLLGLDNSGKTTILYKLKLKKETPPDTIPTVGFNQEAVKYKNITFNMWDCGGQDSIRSLWRHYYNGTQGLIFVIDSSAKSRLDEAKTEIHKIIENPEMRNVPVVILANKQDLDDALSPELLVKYLNLNAIQQSWEIFGTCAKDGSGLLEALTWLSKNVDVSEIPARK
ncbi:hypothetical protein HDU76_001776 [Blyttiomyces sp. JEL0837]|nr:hypothetical protein HDU76_001776 [Blyttiomyces sp. JEL0837]